MANLTETIHAHMPAGRYEQYRAKHDYLLTQSQGEARYLLDKQLDNDAKRYARNVVARDIIVAAVVVGGAVFVGKEVKAGTLKETLTSIPQKLTELSARIKALGSEKINAGLEHVGSEVAKGAATQMQSRLPDLLAIVKQEAPAIGKAAAAGALGEVQNVLPQITDELEVRLQMAGASVAATILATLESGLPHMAETFAASLRSIPGLLLFGKSKT